MVPGTVSSSSCVSTLTGSLGAREEEEMSGRGVIGLMFEGESRADVPKISVSLSMKKWGSMRCIQVLSRRGTEATVNWGLPENSGGTKIGAVQKPYSLWIFLIILGGGGSLK